MFNFLSLASAIIAAVEDTARKISFWFTGVLYPLISKLYETFELIARHRFFSDSDTINGIVNNLFIIFATVMLFIFSIKLINSIIDPEMLTDKKKGVSSMAKRTIAGVILIVLIPWLFNEAYKLQDLVLSKSIVQKIVLNNNGIDLEDSKNVLYTYAIQTVIEPRYNVLEYDESTDYEEQLAADVTANMLNSVISMDASSIIENAANVGGTVAEYEMAICALTYVNSVKDPNYLGNLGQCINSRFGADEGSDYIFKYSGILAIILGFFLAYEMLLLCIDIALRTVKLAFLQIISPLVIAGYIFSGETLQKWAKEVLATYILLFVKIVAVSAMLLGVTLIPDFISRSSFSEHSTIIKILIIIGLLQLVKQLPTIINTIFGTNIKSQGGIKGRLADMAGVGKMASEAWSKLGGKAKGLGKTVALAPVSAAGSKIKKDWNRLAETNNPAGNFAARVNQAMHGKTGRVLRTLKAGVNSNGKGTAKALTEAWNKDAVTQASKAQDRIDRVSRRNARNNMNEAGTATVFLGADGKPSKTLNAPYQIPEKIKKIKRNENESDADFAKRVADFNKQVAARNDLTIKGKIKYHMDKQKQLTMDLTNTFNNIKNNSSIGADGQQYLSNYYSLLEKKNKLSEAKSYQDNMIAVLESAKNNIIAYGDTDSEEAENIRKKFEGLIGTIKGNGFYTKSVDDQLAAFNDLKKYIDDDSYGDLEESAVKFNKLTEGLSAKGATAIGQEVATIDKDVENASKVLDKYRDGLNNEADKSEFEAYKNILDVKATEKVRNDVDLVYSNSDAAKRYYGQDQMK